MSPYYKAFCPVELMIKNVVKSVDSAAGIRNVGNVASGISLVQLWPDNAFVFCISFVRERIISGKLFSRALVDA